MPKKKTPKKSPGSPDESSGTLSLREHIAGGQKGSVQDEHESEISFGSMPGQEDHTFVDNVENLYENQHGLFSSAGWPTSYIGRST